MLGRSFTKAELQLNQLKHKQLPPQIDFALLQNDTLKPVHYLITPQKSTSAINLQTNSPSLTHCSQIIPFYDTSFLSS